MDDHNYKPWELTPEYLLGRINLLESAVDQLAQICSAYMPPAGQESLSNIGNALDKAQADWSRANKNSYV